MVRKIYKSSDSVVLALPKEMLDVLRLQEGEDVAVELDPARQQIVISRIPSPADGVDAEFARQVAEFIDDYRPALAALAK
jgi:antitoxin component of MazEF toxin-antitoxin module